jgi:hypothetical protein
MKIGMQQKFSDVNLDEIKMKMDIIKHEPRQQVQMYLNDWTNCARKGR